MQASSEKVTEAMPLTTIQSGREGEPGKRLRGRLNGSTPQQTSRRKNQLPKKKQVENRKLGALSVKGFVDFYVRLFGYTIQSYTI